MPEAEDDTVDIALVPTAVSLRVLFDLQLMNLEEALENNTMDLTTEEGVTALGHTTVTMQMLYNLLGHVCSYAPYDEDEVPLPEIKKALDATVQLLMQAANQFFDVEELRQVVQDGGCHH